MSQLEEDRQPLPTIPADWDTIKNPVVSMIGQTYSYFNRDEVSSALQKSIRRCQTDEAIQWTCELFWMGPNSKTNLWNRFLVMSVEDIGPANANAILSVYALRQQGEDNILAAVTVAKMLAESKKSRVNDWACHYLPTVAHSADALVQQIGSLETILHCLIQALEQKDISSCLYYMTILFHTTVKVTKKRYRLGQYRHAQQYFWLALDQVHPDCKYIQICREIALGPNWRWQGKSKLIHAHLIHLLCSDLDLNKVDMDDSLFKVEQSKVDQLKVEQYRQRQGLLGIPNYAIDKHTFRGKKLGRGFKHFLKHGAHIENADSYWEQVSAQYLQSIKEYKVNKKNPNHVSDS